MKRDGHIHSPYCPHGTTDSFEAYIEKAIVENFSEITFTEHAPLPKGFIDTTPDKDSGMLTELLPKYFEDLQKLKAQYAQHIKINIGLEIDFITGYEKQSADFLHKYGAILDDAILSVHFLQFNDTYCCIDFSPEVFADFAKQVGSVQAVYDLYYKTVAQSITADLGLYKPKRIGHPSLIHKFQLAHNEKINDKAQLTHILQLLQAHHYELDVNSAGLSKHFCQESYPPPAFITQAKQMGIPLVFGSDAHTVADLHQHYHKISL